MPTFSPTMALVATVAASLLSHRAPLPTLPVHANAPPGSSERSGSLCRLEVPGARRALEHICWIGAVAGHRTDREIGPDYKEYTELDQGCHRRKRPVGHRAGPSPDNRPPATGESGPRLAATRSGS